MCQACFFPPMVPKSSRMVSEYGCPQISEYYFSEIVAPVTEGPDMLQKILMKSLDGESFHSSAIVSLPRVRTPTDSHSSAQATSEGF
uniref:Uncharacterized protein n=1 Tax=Arundo donax TaxID=35708 RepID=A0A0A9D6G8_ARUDO